MMLWLLLLCGLANASLVFQETEWAFGFTVLHNGKEVLVQRPGFPVVVVGEGVANFTESHGNFELDDVILYTRPLDMYVRAENFGDRLEIDLTSMEDLSVKYHLHLQEDQDNPDHLHITAAPPNPDTFPFNRVWLRLAANPDEKVVGGGEQYTYFNMRGREYPIWTREQGVGRDGGVIANITDIDNGAGGDYHTTYWPQASFVSSRHYAFMVRDASYLVLDFAPPDHHRLYLHSNKLEADLIWSHSMGGAAGELARRVGMPPPLPEWILGGAILGLQRGTEEMLSRYHTAADAGVAVSGLWIQDWSGKTETIFGYRVYWNWQWNQTYYPGLDDAITQLSSEGVRVLAYMNPHLIEGGGLFGEADSLGFLMTDAEGRSFTQDFGGFMAGTVDLLRDDARSWYAGKIRDNLIDLGLGGWMADFGEYTRLDMYTHAEGHYTHEEVHNLLPVYWAKCNREALEGSGRLGEVVAFFRSGGLGSAAYQTLAWAGDQNVDWSEADGLPSTITAALSLGMSGMCLSHFDIGGYTTQPPVLKRSKQLFLRSAEYAVFTPVMRTHEGNKPAANHQFYTDEDTLAQFARLTQMHVRLVPYAMEAVQACSDYGTPVQAHLLFEDEADPLVWHDSYKHQYLYGPDLMVAPVTTKDAESVDAYLPGSSEWRLLLGNQTFQAPSQVSVAAPLGYPAVFYRAGSKWQALFEAVKDEFGL